MQATEAYIGSGQRVDLPIDEKGNREMQDVLSRSLPSFYRKAYRQLGNAADAEDAVQDALLSAYKHLDQFKGQAQMSTWLTAIVINSARMQLRRRPRQIHLSLDERFGEERRNSKGPARTRTHEAQTTSAPRTECTDPSSTGLNLVVGFGVKPDHGRRVVDRR